MEPEEVSEFEKQMNEAGEGNMRHIALAISVLAVLVAMVTVMGHRTHTEAVLQQTLATDQWNQFTGAKIRLELDANAAIALSLQPNVKDPGVQAAIKKYQIHVDKLTGEIPEEKEKAEDIQADVARAEKRADRYDLGEALLQIAVVLSSITLLTRQKAYFLLGLMLGAAGLLIAASAFLVH